MRRGDILAIDDEFFHDQGAYIRTRGARFPICGRACCPDRIAFRPIAWRDTFG